MRILALFDFDGTVTTKDSTTAFLKFAIGYRQYYFRRYFFLSPYLVLYKLGFLKESNIKRIRNRIMLGGMQYDVIGSLADQFSKELLPTLIRRSAAEKLEFYKREGAAIMIVSASLDILVKGWSEKNGFIPVSNTLAVLNGRITGEFERPDCNYEVKKERILELVNPADFDEIHAYGDTPGDYAMFSLAHSTHYRYFEN